MKKIFSKLVAFTLLVVCATSLVACGKCKNDPHARYKAADDELLETTYVNGVDCLDGLLYHYKCSLCGEEYTEKRTHDGEHSFSKLIQNGDEYNVVCRYCDRPSLFESFTVTNPSQRVASHYSAADDSKFIYSIEVSDAEVSFQPKFDSTYTEGWGGKCYFLIKANIKVNNFRYYYDYSSNWYIPCSIKFSVGDTVLGEYETVATFSNSGDTKIGERGSVREDSFDVEGMLPIIKVYYDATKASNDQVKVECTILSEHYWSRSYVRD